MSRIGGGDGLVKPPAWSCERPHARTNSGGARRHPPAGRTGGGCLQGHSRPLRIHRSTSDSRRQQGVTSRKINYLVVPYRAITSYSIETAGTLDMDSELKIWTSGRTDPIQKALKSGANIRGIQAAIAAAL